MTFISVTTIILTFPQEETQYVFPIQGDTNITHTLLIQEYKWQCIEYKDNISTHLSLIEIRLNNENTTQIPDLLNTTENLLWEYDDTIIAYNKAIYNQQTQTHIDDMIRHSMNWTDLYKQFQSLKRIYELMEED